ncbi:uncharacterized protein LOC131696295 [Topomyia yanbarensis]|uniref:uncharacterized protein LOC131696295 n=1 Tax=Topomyia yanbarensis TaxID=2498891 RepID=UPI00273AF219|nr:uncharacterized protein LOC131696295 [Topomyia yanbarensis]
MFHQIFIRKADRHSQRFLFRENPRDAPEIYLMNVAIFGSTCSPASAQYVKNKNANEFKELYPRAVNEIVQNHYVDDSIESYESVEEAIKVSAEMRSIHKHGGFELWNWLSNSNQVLIGLGEPLPQRIKKFTPDKTSDYDRVIGMLWSTHEDVFSFSIEMKPEIEALIRRNERPTKRQMLRIGELLTLTDVENWRWVPSKQNPADIATKWGKGPNVVTNSVWFTGPVFLLLTETEWPKQVTLSSPTEEELRPCYSHKSVQFPTRIVELERFSQLNRAIRAVANVYRFVEILKQRTSGQKPSAGPLTSEELQKAERHLIRETQWQSFPDEMVVLSRYKLKPVDEQISIGKSSNIYQLCPTLDENGIIRVDGRIGEAPNLKNEVKFPVILPNKHPFTVLLVDSYHRRYRHCNPETIVNKIRQRYYIPTLRIAVRRAAKACQWCRIYKASPKVPRMAPLPLARMASFVRPFTYVGIDFFGPLAVKVGRSNAKRWVAVFTCLTVRAVHVEVTHNLTTESCIKCIRRFICRRGSPAEIYSDNGTNFQGAARLLKEQIDQLAVTFTCIDTKWIFNPPGTPHMGGAWERMVRSIKTAVELAYNNNRRLDDEALETFIVEAVAIVNSRPLTYLTLASEEHEALTPNHFLLGNSSGVRQPAMETTASTRRILEKVDKGVSPYADQTAEMVRRSKTSNRRGAGVGSWRRQKK